MQIKRKEVRILYGMAKNKMAIQLMDCQVLLVFLNEFKSVLSQKEKVPDADGTA